MNCDIIRPCGGPCGNPGAVPVKGICLHEHIEDGRACPECLAENLYCDACFRRGCDYCRSTIVVMA